MGLDGIYVRDYEFEKPGEYSMDHVDQIRHAFETPEWSSMVRERERKTGESTDIMMKMVNGESRGLFILSAEPKELSIVLILGPIRMDDLSKIQGVAGLGGIIGPTGAMSGVQHTPRPKDKEQGQAEGQYERQIQRQDRRCAMKRLIMLRKLIWTIPLCRHHSAGSHRGCACRHR